MAHTPPDGEERVRAAAAARERLVEFLEEFRELLDGLLHERPDWFGYRHATLVDLWDAEVKALIETVTNELRRTPPQPAPQDFPPEAVDDALHAHGLTGNQLEVKLAPLHPALAALFDEMDSTDEAEAFWNRWLSRLRGSRAARLIQSQLGRVRSAGRHAVRSKLGRVLRIADKILDSLGEALAFIPGVGSAVSATREFKEALEVVIEEPDAIPLSDVPVRQSALAGLRQRVMSRRRV